MISSTSNKMIKDYKKLLLKKHRQKEEQFLIEGWHLIEEANKVGALKKIITTKEYSLSGVESILVSEEVIKTLSNFKTPPQVIGVCSFIDNKINYSDNYLILDEVQDPGNVGTIIRNALAFNFKNIVLSTGCADIYNDKVIQASQGAIFKVNILRDDVAQKIKELQEKDYIVIASSLSNAKPLSKDVVIDSKKAIILGNEGSGIREEILELVDLTYYININNIDSLNVASASSILLYQFSE
ncbi:MAG: RNA methyltransferase [Erysipelotrichales bacterium]